MKNLYLILIVLLLGCSGSSDPDDSFIPFLPLSTIDKGDRMLGILPSEDIHGFESAFDISQEAGTEFVELSLNWNDFESKKKRYEDKNGIFESVAFYKMHDIKLALSIANINTVATTEPDYLKDIPIDDSIYVEAFVSFADWLIYNLSYNVDIVYVSLGNESDIYYSRGDYFKFINFFKEAYSQLKELHPNITFGSKCTLMNYLFSDKKNLIQQVYNTSDVAMINYYPMDASFQVMDPKIVREHFEEVDNLYSHDIYFTEVGYQSGSGYCNSSEGKQAEFFHELFEQWDKYSSKVKILNINWLHDVTPDQLVEFENYYGSSDPAFLEFLGTLGIRNNNSTNKYAWEQILLETELRGF
jgi:hypothetical protein